MGAKFDRFGGYIDKNTGLFTDKGTFVAPFGSDYTGRALPAGTDSKAFKGYEVLKPIPSPALSAVEGKEGPAIPWFGEKGNGMQYELSMGIKACPEVPEETSSTAATSKKSPRRT